MRNFRPLVLGLLLLSLAGVSWGEESRYLKSRIYNCAIFNSTGVLFTYEIGLDRLGFVIGTLKVAREKYLVKIVESHFIDENHTAEVFFVRDKMGHARLYEISLRESITISDKKTDYLELRLASMFALFQTEPESGRVSEITSDRESFVKGRCDVI